MYCDTAHTHHAAISGTMLADTTGPISTVEMQGQFQDCAVSGKPALLLIFPLDLAGLSYW